jgi:hypothetical protein
MFAARLIAVGAATLVAVAGLVVSGAHAQSAGECGCFAASAGSAVGVATLTSTTGRVVVSGSAAPRIGAAGQRLSVGERVAVGANGGANVSLGSCSLAVQSGQELLLQRLGDGICASVPSAAGATVQSGVSPVPFVLGGTAALAVGAALAVSSGDDSPASP